ncbi:hypothetical protein GCM10029963_01490 [Micromonospora andamanensis]
MLALDGTGLNLADVADGARRRLDPVHWDFFAGGAGDERTLRANEEAFTRHRILPRILRGALVRDLRISLLGCRLAMPVLIAPTAFHRLAHPEGEVATADAAAEAGTIMVVSMAATRPLEEIAAAGGRSGFSSIHSRISGSPRLWSAGPRPPAAVPWSSLSTRPCSVGGNATCGTASSICRPDCSARTCATRAAGSATSRWTLGWTGRGSAGCGS